MTDKYLQKRAIDCRSHTCTRPSRAAQPLGSISNTIRPSSLKQMKNHCHACIAYKSPVHSIVAFLSLTITDFLK